MGTHVIAFFITTTAYTFARRNSDNPRFVFGTGKVGELAAYTSAVILIIIALYILYAGIDRFVHPQPLDWFQSLGVAFVGLGVNILSGFILGCGPMSSGEKGADGEDIEVTHGHGHTTPTTLPHSIGSKQ